MKHRLIYKQNKGFTLIELLISMAILSIVMTAIMGLFLHNNMVFKKSDKLSQVQFDVRMASDYITTEFRNVNSISLSDNTLPNSVNITSLSDKYPLVKSVSFEIKTQGARYLLSYVIQGSDSNLENHYQLKTEVLLNNITSATNGNNTTVYYRK